MKKSILVFSQLLLFFTSFAQQEVKKDSITNVNGKNHLVIRCQASIKNTASPMLIVDGAICSYENISQINPDKIVSINVIKEPMSIGCYGGLSKNGIILINTKNRVNKREILKDLPFKFYTLFNSDWNTTQDIYNSIQSKVPGVTIATSSNSPNQTPSIRMRGDDNTIVIVDGVRFDASILNTLNPSDIQHVQVAPSAAATNYFVNN